jgi:hypothetical protein
MSDLVSLSPASSASWVSKKTTSPNCELPSKKALNAPFPPVEPVETWLVVPPERS